MGITIHYNGKIKDLKLLPKLIDDCLDFAQTMGWKYNLITETDAKVKGIILHIHPECESLHLTFGRDGRLRSILDYQAQQLFIKTQFAGIKAHITIIKLLKYLKNHYITNLKVNDEAEYWQSEDIDRLWQKVFFIQSKIEMLKETFKDTEFTDEERQDIFKLSDKVEEVLKKIKFR